MIRLEGVTKRYPGVSRPAVDHLDLDIPEGTICVLIGPSGCGKTTTMRMVNRLIEPTAGRILVAGEDVTGTDPVRLRRTHRLRHPAGRAFPAHDRRRERRDGAAPARLAEAADCGAASRRC